MKFGSVELKQHHQIQSFGKKSEVISNAFGIWHRFVLFPYLAHFYRSSPDRKITDWSRETPPKWRWKPYFHLIFNADTQCSHITRTQNTMPNLCVVTITDNSVLMVCHVPIHTQLQIKK